MSQRNSWIDSALEELELLARRHAKQGLDPSGAFRVLALSTRVEQARTVGRVVVLPEPLRALARHVAPTAQGPRQELLLARLEALLAEGGDPFGQLLDVLLDIDDVVSVDEAGGRGDTARELVRLAAAYVALHPARVGALGGLADGRLALLPADASIRALWDTVADAAGAAVAEALPPLTPAPVSLSQRRLAQRLQAARQVRVDVDVSETAVMQWLIRPAAAERDAGLAELDEEVYLEGEQVVVQVDLPPGKAPAGSLEVRVETGSRHVTWVFPTTKSSRRSVIAKLGTATELRERLAREGFSASAGGIRFIVGFALKEGRNDAR